MDTRALPDPIVGGLQHLDTGDTLWLFNAIHSITMVAEDVVIDGILIRRRQLDLRTVIEPQLRSILRENGVTPRCDGWGLDDDE